MFHNLFSKFNQIMSLNLVSFLRETSKKQPSSQNKIQTKGNIHTITFWNQVD